MIENISLSFQGIWGHKMRSFLTMLGIIIGIAAIISIVSTIKGTNEEIKESLVGSGNNVVSVTLKRKGGSTFYMEDAIPYGVSQISERTRRRLEKLDGVQEVTVYHMRDYVSNVFYGNTVFNGSIYGVDTHYFSVNDYHIEYGRLFTEADLKDFRKVAVIDTDTAFSIFVGENPVGKTLEIGGDAFVVIGVVSRDSDTGPTISTMDDYDQYNTTLIGTLFIPLTDWPIAYRFDEPQNVIVKADSTDDMTAAGKNVADALTISQIAEDVKFKYEAQDLLKKAASMQKISNNTNRQLLWIAGISLLVGGIGVMNIMLVSVTERTKEIGLKKAIGAKRSRILAQFLTEAAVLTSIGGMLGVVAGIVLAKVLANVMRTRASVSIPACVIAVVFSMAIGIVFGLLPAVTASKLNPIDALRTE